MDESDSAVGTGRISSSGFNRWLAPGVEFRHHATPGLKIRACDMDRIRFCRRYRTYFQQRFQPLAGLGR
jgi:hypothetical protein